MVWVRWLRGAQIRSPSPGLWKPDTGPDPAKPSTAVYLQNIQRLRAHGPKSASLLSRSSGGKAERRFSHESASVRVSRDCGPGDHPIVSVGTASSRWSPRRWLAWWQLPLPPSPPPLAPVWGRRLLLWQRLPRVLWAATVRAAIAAGVSDPTWIRGLSRWHRNQLRRLQLRDLRWRHVSSRMTSKLAFREAIGQFGRLHLIGRKHWCQFIVSREKRTDTNGTRRASRGQIRLAGFPRWPRRDEIGRMASRGTD